MMKSAPLPHDSLPRYFFLWCVQNAKMSFANDCIDLIGFVSISVSALTLASWGYKMGAKSAPGQASKVIKQAAEKFGQKV